MTNRSDSQVWADFMNSEFVQGELKKLQKDAQAYSVNMDRNKLYGPAADPKNTTQLSESAETMGVNAGGASLVGSGDSKALYTTKSAPVPGGAEQYADATVEGLEDVQKAMLDVAMREPTGKPLGTQDNAPEKWDGLQAAGKSKKPVKEGQATDSRDSANPAAQSIGNAFLGPKGQKMMGEGEEADLEQILSELEKEDEGTQMALASKKENTVALLKELVKIANELDAQGQHEDASEIDAVIKDEVKTLAASLKK